MRRLLSTARRTREVSRRATLRAGGAALALTVVASLAVTTGAAQAIVITDNGTQAGVSLIPSSRGNLPAGISANTSSAACTDPWLDPDLGGPAIASDALCYRGGSVIHQNETYALTWDAPYPDGSQHHYWTQTRGYVEQYLRDVADASGSLGSPYALTTQYSDAGGRAQNQSLFGGGCIDFGVTGGSSCEFGNPSSAGHDLPASNCTPGGNSFTGYEPLQLNQVCLTDDQIQNEVSTMVSQTGILSRTKPGYTPLVTLLLPPGVESCLDHAAQNNAGLLCSANGYLTPPPPSVSTSSTGGSIPAGTYHVSVTYVTQDAQGNDHEMVPSGSTLVTATTDTSSLSISSPPAGPPSGPNVVGWYAYITGSNGYTFSRQGGMNQINSNLPLTALSSGGQPPTQPAFCSYHSQVNVGGTEVDYVVQPWTVGTSCDEPDVPPFPQVPTASQLSVGAGQRLVSPLSQSTIAGIVDPGLNGWVAQDGSEIDDNHIQGYICQPLSFGQDKVTIGNSSQNPYWIQREFDNGAAIASDPYTYAGCAPEVDLGASFVAPSAVNQGDEVQFDGSSTVSTLVVANDSYHWNFGDGTSATGPSIVHNFDKAGVYTVTLTVTDRGGNQSTTSEAITVLGSGGQTPTPPTSVTPGGGSSGGRAPMPALSVRLQLSPRSLKAVLRHGLALQVNSNQTANGILSVSITRAEAKRAHIKAGPGATVVIARGTTAGIRAGGSILSLRLPAGVAKKLSKLRHATFTIRLSLVASGGGHLSIDAAGRY